MKPTRVDGSPLYPIHYYAPPEGKTPDGFVIVISDNQGWDDAAAALAQHLAAGGNTVVGLELPVYRAALGHEDHECTLVTRDLETTARDIEQTLPAYAQYKPPLIVGIGAGAGIAYAAAAQVLPNTFAGAVALRFDPTFDVGHKMCLPTVSPDGAPLRYGPVGNHDTKWFLAPTAPFFFTPSEAFAGPEGGLKDFVAGMPTAHPVAPRNDDIATVDEAMAQLAKMGKTESSVDGLPLVEIPPAAGKEGQHPLVIFYSGDGGWRDIDKKIGSYLSDQGYFVVGIDSLRYFWRKKEPQTMAADLDRLIRHYGKQALGNGVMLVGYSFGADIIPFMVNRLSADTKSEIRMVSLLGISEHASFEIRLADIVGGTNTDGPPTLPELMKLKGIPIQCVFGEVEKDSVCADKALDASVNRVEMAGGHHFDGDYRHTADLIIGADKTRVSKLK
ncbi:MAG TPA: AcvB/VirJ family lysyl-phosphatidylglycerol hydrolase [Alphaproteobacteria bacterium]|nr:AcvB/VirJ family lysyl-phosphatidylglycerol hydrolase [Alphaproteobacteria bacterium]